MLRHSLLPFTKFLTLGFSFVYDYRANIEASLLFVCYETTQRHKHQRIYTWWRSTNGASFVSSAFSGRWIQATILPYMASYTNPCITTPFIPQIYYVLSTHDSRSMAWILEQRSFSFVILKAIDSCLTLILTIWSVFWTRNYWNSLIYFRKCEHYTVFRSKAISKKQFKSKEPILDLKKTLRRNVMYIFPRTRKTNITD